jgi:CBS domain-containing protein
MTRADYVFPPSRTLEGEVRDIMTPGVVSLPEDAGLRRVHEAMVKHNVHAVLVVERKTGHPLGWVTARGLLPWAGKVGAVRTARQAISEPIETISPSARINRAVELMIETGVSHLLVANRPTAMPEGVVSDMDVVRLDGRP